MTIEKEQEKNILEYETASKNSLKFYFQTDEIMAPNCFFAENDIGETACYVSFLPDQRLKNSKSPAVLSEKDSIEIGRWK